MYVEEEFLQAKAKLASLIKSMSNDGEYYLDYIFRPVENMEASS